MARPRLESGMAHIVGFQRDQLLLLPAAGAITSSPTIRCVSLTPSSMGLALAARGFARVEAKTTGRPGYAPGRSQVRQAANEGETAPIPRNSLLAPSPRVLDADARGSFGDQGHPLEDDSRRALGGRFRQPNLTRERRYRVLVSAQDRERRMCAISIGRLLLYAESGRQECANSGRSACVANGAKDPAQPA